MSSAPVRILLVEDNPGDARLIREELVDSGLVFALDHAFDLAEARGRLEAAEPDVVLLDLSLPDAHGLDTFRTTRAAAPDVPILVLTGLDDETLAVNTVHEGAQDYLVKGDLSGRTLSRAIRYAMERQRAQEALSAALAREREKSEQLGLAIREAHHRIKNNLQAISDLLYLALSAEAGRPTEEVLGESIERIQSIALVHDLLSQDEDVQTVDLRTLAERLVPMALHNSVSHPVGVTLTVPSVAVASRQATALALILNELVSNAAKHALRDRPGAGIQVRVEEEDGGLGLCVRDNGPGLPPTFDLLRDANVGLQVVRTLAERDLGGRLALENAEPGVAASVWFPR